MVVHPPSCRTVLMYHALSVTGAPVEGQDPHYTIARERFIAQLDLVRDTGLHATSARNLLADGDLGGAVALTFDDGHLSNYTLAFPILLERGLRADFFVNPATVGQRGFVSWTQLREMAASGLSIQSHGYDHRYFDDLAPLALRDQLTRSRRDIEDRIGQPVSLLAPPGGRTPTGLLALARDTGYRHVLGSRPGHLVTVTHDRILPRVAVTADLGDAPLRGWITGSWQTRTRAQLRHAALGAAKHLLGNRRYEHLRGRLLGQQE